MEISLSIKFRISRDSHDDSNDEGGHILSDTSWRRIQKQIARRDDFMCQYCGAYTRKGHVDHVIPLSQGGSDDLDNLVWACADCNGAKGNKTVEEWQEIEKDRPPANPDALFNDDGTMHPELQKFHDGVIESGTGIRNWLERLGRRRYQIYRDVLISHGLAQWNCFRWDGTPHRNGGWHLIGENETATQLALLGESDD